MIRHLWIFPFTLLLGVIFVGCFREVVRDPYSAAQWNDKAIVVTTRDGLRYLFSNGDYAAIRDSNGVDLIVGKGKQYRLNSSEYIRFEGGIPFSSIEKMTESETTPFLYISLAALGLMIGFAVWLAIAMSGRSFGG